MKHFIFRIEQGFERFGRLVYGNPWKTIAFVLLLWAAMTWSLPALVVDTSNEAFFEKDDPVLLAYDDFREQFGRDEIVMATIRSENVFDQTFLKKLKAFHEDVENDTPHLDEVISLVNATSIRGEEEELIIEELLEDWPEDERAVARLKKRVLSNKGYRNLLVSEDGTHTSVIIRSNAHSSSDESSVILEDGFEQAFETGDDEPGLSAEEEIKPDRLTVEQNGEFVYGIREVAARHRGDDFPVVLGGSPVMMEDLKTAMMGDVPVFTGIGIGTIGMLLLLLFRNLYGIVLPLLTVVLSLVSALGLMAAFGAPFTLVTQVLPSFLLAVGVGYSVHLLTIYFRQFQRTGNKEEVIAFSMGHSGLAILMTSLTTAGGLLSFTSAKVAPIAELGVFGATGVLLAVFFTLTLLPALLTVLPASQKQRPSQVLRVSLADRVLNGMGEFAVNRPWTVVSASIALAVLAGIGTTQLRFSHNPIAWLPDDNSMRLATEVIDRHMKGAATVEFVVNSGVEDGVKQPGLMNRLEEFNQQAEQLGDGTLVVGKSSSLVDTVKEINMALNEDHDEFYTVPEDRQLIAQELVLFENGGADDLERVVDSQYKEARITVKTTWTDANQYAGLLDQLEQIAEKLFAGNYLVTGLIPLMVRTVNYVMQSMLTSYVIAAVVITALMMLLLTSVRMGLWSMIPNFLPILIGLGVMGMLDLPLDMASILVGSIALGLAVDDTVHFLHNFRRYHHRLGEVHEAVSHTLHSTGRAMLFTTVVLAIGFFTYTKSSLNNLFSFGLITGITIIVALLADLLLAPALMTLIHQPRENPTQKSL